MDIVIDLSSVYNFINQPADILLYQFLTTVGWIPFAIIFLMAFKEMWMIHIQNQWAAMQKYILLAIDIPRGNVQSPKAVENMFAYLAGAHGSINLLEEYWEGKFQRSFSFEIVSIDGYTQFLIRTPADLRNLVETAIYSQYPDAEITEVNDYVTDMPRKFPDEEFDVWGSEFIQAKNGAYPIKSYEEFEHNYGEPEMHYKDPMAALMDLCSSLRPGEQLWYQIIVKPIDMMEWTKIGDDEVKKILKEKPAQKPGLGANIGDFIMDTIHTIMNSATNAFAVGERKKDDKKDDSLKMMNLKPKEKKQVEAIHNKISKIGFDTKVRFVYIAKKDVMNKPKVANGFVGYIKQFAALDLNNLKPDTKHTMTSTAYFFKEYRLNERKNHIVRNYMARDGASGRKMGVLNIEELATIWHFPIESVVKAPLIGKAPGRKAEPPSNVPIGEDFRSEETFRPTFEAEILGKGPSRNGKKRQPSGELPGFPSELPVEDTGPAEPVFIIEQPPAAVPEFMEPQKSEKKSASRGAPPDNLPF